MRWLVASLTCGVACLLVAAWGRFGSLDGVPRNFVGAGSYAEFALRFVEGKGPLDNGRPPGYPLLLAIEAWIVGSSRLAYLAAAVQSALSLAMVWICHRAGARLGGAPAWGFVAAALVATNLSLQFEFLAARETCLYAILVLLTATALMRDRATSGRRATIIGVLAAASWLTRPTGFLVVIGAALCIAMQREWRTVLLFAAGVALPIMAWCGYQAANHEGVHISGKSAQRTFYYSWHPALDVVYPLVDIDHLDPIVDATEAQWITEGRDPGAMYRREGLRFVLEDPMRTLLLVGRKAGAFFLPLQFPFADGDIAAEGSTYTIEHLKPLPLRGMLLGGSALFGVAGYFLALMRLRSLPRGVLFIVSVVTATTLLHLATFAETRYRQPFDPALALVAVWAAAEHLREKARKRRTDQAESADRSDEKQDEDDAEARQ